MNAGERISDYIVECVLGEGGMGTVYLASHTVLDQQVAIKILDPEVARKPGVRERFVQEANIQAKLVHPNIVRVLTATNNDGGIPALIMDYVQGKSLSEVLKLRGALPVQDAIEIMEQVLSAVGYAHRQGVIHRDLKPSNVMVMATGEAKVTDFGIAKVLGSSKLTRTGTAMGSAHYMSPEQIRRPETVDACSDIYSLGCVFYELLTGQPPFGEKDLSGTESDYEVKTAHVTEAVPSLETVNSSIPAWLGKLVMSMLAKEADQRPSSCEAIASAFASRSDVDKTQINQDEKKPDWGQTESDRNDVREAHVKTAETRAAEKKVDKSVNNATLIGVGLFLAIVAILFFWGEKSKPNQQEDAAPVGWHGPPPAEAPIDAPLAKVPLPPPPLHDQSAENITRQAEEKHQREEKEKKQRTEEEKKQHESKLKDERDWAAACHRSGCTAKIDALSIESSRLEKLSGQGNDFRLIVLIRNIGTSSQAWPALRLQLNNAAGQTEIYKIFKPSDFLSAREIGAGLPAASEREIPIHFELSGNATPHGFNIGVFYPNHDLEQEEKRKQPKEKERLAEEKQKREEQERKRLAEEEKRQKEEQALKDKKKLEEEQKHKQEMAEAEEKKRKQEAAAAEEQKRKEAAAAEERKRKEAAAAEKQMDKNALAWELNKAGDGDEGTAEKKSGAPVTICELFIGQTVKSNTSFPSIAGDPVVTIGISLTPSRELKGVKVVKTSGYPEFDKQVERGVRRTKRFPRECPEEFSYDHYLKPR
jgi:serine/threonine-protein kinase